MNERYNSGVLFSVRAKRNPKGPDYTGELLIDTSSLEVVDGKITVKLSGWKKTSKAGTSFLSLAINTYKPEQKETSFKQGTTQKQSEEEDLF